jgi:predicted aspartyl protease
MQVFWPEKPNGKEPVGEVRVKVKLTNALDDALLRRQQIRPDQVRTYEADALIDTGGVRTVIPARVVEKLGIQVRSSGSLNTPMAERTRLG